MKRLVMAGLLAGVVTVALAMPTKDELAKAQPLVNELMVDDLAALKAKTKKAAEVGDASVKFAGEAETEAVKFLLFKGAITFYTRGGEYDKAADAVNALKAAISDMPPAVVADVIATVLKRVPAPAKNAPRLFAQYRVAQTQVQAAEQVETLKRALAKTPGDAKLQQALAEACARSGNWKSALWEFVKCGGAVAKTAQTEIDGSSLQVAADAWWAYEPIEKDEADTFKIHAASLYKLGLANGSIAGLKATIAEKRVKQMEAYDVPAPSSPDKPDPRKGGLYCIIDVSAGMEAQNYPVSYLSAPPRGGWSDEFKTTKIVLRRIKPGRFVMGDLVHGGDEKAAMELTQPYYIGVFEVTQKQWELVMGTWPSFWRNRACGASRPVENVSYDMIRGEQEGCGWPISSAVDEVSFLGVLRKKTGLDFDLPTEVQWEFACRAGSKSDYGTGKNWKDENIDRNMNEVGRYQYNGGWNRKWGKLDWGKVGKIADQDCDTSFGTAKVGSYKPNAWGLYDMHGNVWEWCLDWKAPLVAGRDQKGSDSGKQRIIRGSSWGGAASNCTSAYRGFATPKFASFVYGFRLALPLGVVPAGK